MIFDKNKMFKWIFLGITGLFSSYLFAASKANLNFDEMNINSSIELIHPVVIADLYPAVGKELLTIGVDNEQLRWLIIYGYNKLYKNYTVVDKLLLPKEFYSFDLSEYHPDKLQKLYFLGRDQLFVYQPLVKALAKKFTKIANISSIFLKSDPQFINQGEFIYDLNEDGIDDTIISDFSETHILLGQANGKMVTQAIALKPRIQILKNSAKYTQTKIYVSDMNFDHKLDLITVAEGRLAVYYQLKNDQFSLNPQYLTVKSSISGIEWWNKKDSVGNSLDQSHLIYRKLEDLRDVDHDGIVDLIVRYTKSSGVLDRVNDYEVYLGKNKQGKLYYPVEPDSIIHAEGTLTGLEFVDVNNDDKLEVLLSGFDIGLSEIIAALLSGSIDQNVYVFKMDRQNQFAKTPSISKTVDLSFSLSSGKTGNAVVKLADLNGDGLKDLVLSDNNTLKIYTGEDGKRLFARRAIKYKTILPKDGNVLLFDDLNNDGKDDILFQYGRLDDKHLARRIKVLLAD